MTFVFPRAVTIWPCLDRSCILYHSMTSSATTLRSNFSWISWPTLAQSTTSTSTSLWRWAYEECQYNCAIAIQTWPTDNVYSNFTTFLWLIIVLVTDSSNMATLCKDYAGEHVFLRSYTYVLAVPSWYVLVWACVTCAPLDVWCF